MFQNPNVSCDLNCRFSEIGPAQTTLAYYTPIYDKNGINVNPDGNTTSGSIGCSTCSKQWRYHTQFGKTTYTEIED